MFDYSVTFSFELFSINTGVYAANTRLAKKYAKERILECAGLDVDDLSHEITVEIMGRLV
jgi:hypothetical protein